MLNLHKLKLSHNLTPSLLLLFIVAFLVFVSPAMTSQGHGGTPKVEDKTKEKFRKVEKKIHDEYIVVLKDDVADDEIDQIAEELVQPYNGKIKFKYKSALKGFSVRISEAAAAEISNDPRVDFVEENARAELTSVQTAPLPWGLDRIDQPDRPLNNAYRYDATGQGINVYVIDTGIRGTHQEFGGRVRYAPDFSPGGGNGVDCHGHGTHVAGIIGGATHGVAKGVTLYSVRVVDCNAGGGPDGAADNVIAGVDWVTANHITPAVANMSLRFFGGNTAVDTAVTNSITRGVTYVVGAGNNNENANNNSPARVTRAITVGATNISDFVPTWSGGGSVIDLFAPGEDIDSAGIKSDSEIVSMDGTSMSSPHVAGVRVYSFSKMKRCLMPKEKSSEPRINGLASTNDVARVQIALQL